RARRRLDPAQVTQPNVPVSYRELSRPCRDSARKGMTKPAARCSNSLRRKFAENSYQEVSCKGAKDAKFEFGQPFPHALQQKRPILFHLVVFDFHHAFSLNFKG